MKIDHEKLLNIASKLKSESSRFEESSVCIGVVDGVAFRLQVFSPAKAEEEGDIEALPRWECLTPNTQYGLCE